MIDRRRKNEGIGDQRQSPGEGKFRFNGGVKDILILCAGGLTGIQEAIAAAFPKTEYQRCIVHQVRNTLKYVSDKDRKAFAADL